MFHGLMNNPVL